MKTYSVKYWLTGAGNGDHVSSFIDAETIDTVYQTINGYLSSATFRVGVWGKPNTSCVVRSDMVTHVEVNERGSQTKGNESYTASEPSPATRLAGSPRIER